MSTLTVDLRESYKKSKLTKHIIKLNISCTNKQEGERLYLSSFYFFHMLNIFSLSKVTVSWRILTIIHYLSKKYNWNRCKGENDFLADISSISTRGNKPEQFKCLWRFIVGIRYIFSAFGKTRDISHNFSSFSSGFFSCRLHSESP